MLIDTDVLIWYLRGSPKAKAVLDEMKEISISCVTHMEIVQGLRNHHELRLWKSYLKERLVRQILIDAEISAKAMYLMEEFSLSHRLRMADALIAATANVYGLDFLTGNAADYKFLPGLSLKIFRPH